MVRTIAAVFVMWSSTTFAQPAGAQAEVLFQQGRELMFEGKVAEACSAFDESHKLEPLVTTLLNLATCRERLGELATAWELFLAAERETRTASDAEGQQLHALAQAGAQRVEPHLSRLTILVPLRSQIDGLEIARGTERVAAGLWNIALPINGGTYTIAARAPGANQWSTEVSIAADGDSKTVEIPDLPNLLGDVDKATAPKPSPVAVATIDRGPAPHASSNVVPLAVGAGALALLGGGLGFELRAESRYAAAKSEMMNQQRRDSLYNSANTNHHIAEAFAVSGLISGAAALWLYLRDRNSEPGATTSASVRVVPMMAGLALSGQFR